MELVDFDISQIFGTALSCSLGYDGYLRMHSTLQNEVRLTHRFFQTSCRKCTLRCESPRRFFHRSRDVRSSQGARDNADSHPTPPAPEANTETENKPEITSSPSAPGFALPSSIAQHFFSQGGSPPDGPDQPPPNAYYGSSANRRLRTRNTKSEPNAVLPEWFGEINVTLWDDGMPATWEGVEEASSLTAATQELEEARSPDGSSPDATDESSSNPAGLECSAESSETMRPQELNAFGASQEARSASRKARPYASRYYIEASQDQEIIHTMRGMIRAPERREFRDEPALRTAHLLLHYAGKDGELLLDEYVRNAASRLRCDLVTLDAQDIAELISTAQKGADITRAGRMLSYDVLKEKFKDMFPEAVSMEGPSMNASSMSEEFDEEDENDPSMENPSSRSPFGMPILLGKPITIDLGNVFGAPGGRRGASSAGNPQGPGKFFSDLFKQPNQQQRSPSEQFTNLVESLLSVVPSKRVEKAKASKDWRGASEAGSAKKTDCQDCTIVHIKDIKAIQERKIGGDFMQEVYAQVNKRRDNGENIMLIGTECEKLDSFDYPQDKIDQLQQAKDHEISRTIVITPAFHKPWFRADLFKDKKKRKVAINLRHIWEMMRLRSQDNFLDLPPGFWRDDVSHKLAKSDQEILEGEVWSFSRVHRLCSLMTGLHMVEKPSLTEFAEGKVIPMISIADALLKSSDKTKRNWANTQQEKDFKLHQSKNVENTKLTEIRASATKHEKRLMSGIIEADKISTTFDDVYAPTATIEALQTLTTLSLIRPEAFSYGVLASDKIPGLLLYGPPGTGKTLLAKAVAKESGATMLEVSAAEINDMFVGEGEKNVKALFSLAKKLSPCVVFLDEADAMFSARSNSGRRVSHRELLNQFLKEWDGMSNDSGSAFIMVATNRPMDLDDAVLRRLPRRLLVDLPAEPDRLEILKIHLRNEQLAEDVDLADLAKKTPFYSGSDLKNLAVTAALNAVREEHEASKKHKGEEAYEYPEKRTLRREHFENALEEISASISEDMSSLKDIKKFDEQYGDKRGKRRKGPKWGFKSATEADKVADTVKVRS